MRWQSKIENQRPLQAVVFGTELVTIYTDGLVFQVEVNAQRIMTDICAFEQGHHYEGSSVDGLGAVARASAEVSCDKNCVQVITILVAEDSADDISHTTNDVISARPVGVRVGFGYKLCSAKKFSKDLYATDFG